MITEDYVNFGIAKLLKEKGFVPPFDYEKWLPSMYYKNGEIQYGVWSKEWFPRITLQMAMKWLREVKDIYIDVTSRFSFNADKDVCFSYSIKQLIDKYKSNSIASEDGEWLTYEEACEGAIKYCLENLI